MTERFAQQSEDIDRTPVILTAIGVVIVIVIGTLIAYGILAVSSGPAAAEEGGSAVPPRLGPLQSSLIGREAVRHRPAPAPVAYNDYGWVDRDAGVIHVPLDVAIDLYLEQQADAATPGGAR